MPIVPEVGRQRQEESEFEVDLVIEQIEAYIMRIYLKIIISNNNNACSIVMTGEIVKW